MTPSEWGQVGIGGIVSAIISALGTWFVKRADQPKPQKVDVAQIETVTKGLGDLVDDLQAERRELRHMNRNLRMELDRAYDKAAKAEAALLRVEQMLAMAEAVIGTLEQLAAASGAQVSPAIAATIQAIRGTRGALEPIAP